MKIAILKPSSLGDVVQAIPVLRMLKLHWPDAEVHWWIETNSASLLERDPDLAGIVRFDRKRWGTPWHYGDIWKCIRELRSHRFDLVIDLQALARSAAVAWFANGKLTVGLQDWRELAPASYDLSVPRPSAQTHAVDWYLEVLKRLRVPIRWDFEWLPKNFSAAQTAESKWNLRDEAIAILPGARWLNKRWPVEHFAEFVRLQHRTAPQRRFLIIGGKGDSELAQVIAAAVPGASVDLTGRTNLPEVVEILRACKLVVTNDTGPMHIAAALGKPVVGLFGPTNPARTGPYGQVPLAIQRHDLPCVPCLKDTCHWRDPMACLRGITPAAIASTVDARITAP